MGDLPPVTRLAPTPSGALHVGNARTFLATWGLARRLGWKIVLRLEDLDIGRVKAGAHEESSTDLAWLGIDWDDAPLVQSADLSPYRDALEKFARAGQTFPCGRSRSEIRTALSAPHADDGEARFPPALRPTKPWPNTIETWETNHRFALDPAPEFVFDALLGPQTFDPGLEVGDMVLWTKLGMPAYQLAVVIDDARQGVTDVVRGDDLLASAARQQVIARALGLQHARWWHVPLVYGEDGKRLAKRHGSHSLQALRNAQVAPERVIGWCAWTLGLMPTCEPLPACDFCVLCTPEALRESAQRLRTQPTIFGPQDLAFLEGRSNSHPAAPSASP